MRIILIILFTISLKGIWAQDSIFIMKRRVLTGKVIEVNKDNIRFYKNLNSEGPVYSIRRGAVSSIKYENGVVEVFNKKSLIPPVVSSSVYHSEKYTKLDPQMVASGVWVFGTLGGYRDETDKKNYEKIIAPYVRFERKIDEKLSFTATGFFAVNKSAVGTALGLNIHPRNFGRFRSHLEPMFVFTLKDFYYKTYSGTQAVITPRKTLESTFLFNWGLQFLFNRQWVLISDVGVGVVTGNSARNKLGVTDMHTYLMDNVMASARIGIGYRF